MMPAAASRISAFCFVLLSVALSLGASPAQDRVDVQGDFVEPLSTLSFPPRIHGWERGDVLKYPEPGGHSVTYQLRTDGSLVTATVYLYPQASGMPATLQEHYSATLKGLLALGRGAELVSENTDPIERDGRVIEHRLATVLCRDGYGPHRGPTVEFLSLSKIGSIWLKWRITVPASAPAGVTGQIVDLKSAFVPRPLDSQTPR